MVGMQLDDTRAFGGTAMSAFELTNDPEFNLYQSIL
jgi:hypothetical protein